MRPFFNVMKIFYSILLFMSIGGLLFTDYIAITFFNQHITIRLIIGFLTTILASIFTLYLLISWFLKQPVRNDREEKINLGFTDHENK